MKICSIGRNILFYLIIIFNFQKLRTSFDSYELLNFQVMKGRQRIDNFAKQKKKKERKTLNLNIFSPLQIPQHLQHWQALSNIEPMIIMSVTSLISHPNDAEEVVSHLMFSDFPKTPQQI